MEIYQIILASAFIVSMVLIYHSLRNAKEEPQSFPKITPRKITYVKKDVSTETKPKNKYYKSRKKPIIKKTNDI